MDVDAADIVIEHVAIDLYAAGEVIKIDREADQLGDRIEKGTAGCPVPARRPRARVLDADGVARMGRPEARMRGLRHEQHKRQHDWDEGSAQAPIMRLCASRADRQPPSPAVQRRC